MKYAAEMASSGIVDIPIFRTIISGIEVLLRLLLKQFERLQCCYYWWKEFIWCAVEMASGGMIYTQNKTTNSRALVRQWTIPTERAPLVVEEIWHDIHTKFHTDRFRLSKLLRGMYTDTDTHKHTHTHTQKSKLIILLLFFQNKESRLEIVTLHLCVYLGCSEISSLTPCPRWKRARRCVRCDAWNALDQWFSNFFRPPPTWPNALVLSAPLNYPILIFKT
jgi:hypothetical protein